MVFSVAFLRSPMLIVFRDAGESRPMGPRTRITAGIGDPCGGQESHGHHPNSRRNTLIVEAQVTIHGSKAAVWATITNIENSSKTISGIESVEVLEKPATGLKGLRWRETRMYFGKPATVEKQITDAAG
jgi:hypothetical protein